MRPEYLAIRKLPIDKKHKLFSLWMSRERIKDSLTIDLMFLLDDEWDEVYNEYRIKEGFTSAKLRANERILSIVYN